MRAACHVTKGPAGPLELLVFDHSDFPDVGTQIPAGDVEAGETFPEAALREVHEETGLEHVEFLRLLGEVRSTTDVHLRSTRSTSRRWQHVVRGRGEDADLRFDCPMGAVAD